MRTRLSSESIMMLALTGILVMTVVVSNMNVIMSPGDAAPSGKDGGSLNIVMVSNLIRNPGFERNIACWSSTDGTATYLKDNNNKHSGRRSAKGIETDTDNLGRLYQDVTSKCVSGNWYKISGWIKTQDVEGSVVIALHYVDATGATPGDGNVAEIGDVTGTQDWAHFESDVFTLPVMPSDCVALWFLLDFSNGKGTAWFDDVSLIKSTTPPPAT